MSSASNTTSTSSNFEAIFNAALTEYTKQTGKDLRDHPFASKIDSCDNPDSIIAIFQEQARAFDEFRKGDTKLFRWFKPIIKVLHSLSTNEVLSEGASSVRSATFAILILNSIPKVFPPAKAVFSGIEILLSVRFFLLTSAQLFVTFRIVRRLRT
jgi:fungal STAND N-terminal Goodbye domain